MQDDALLIRRAQKGDAAAFEALLAPHERKLYALCLRMMGNPEDAADCLQEAMLHAWRAMASYKRTASFATWCYRIASNACVDMLRRKKARPAASLDVLGEAGFSPPAGPSADPQAQAEAAARRQLLQAGIAALPEDQRLALILRDVQGFSYEEVAQMTDTTLGTVKSRINRARTRLRESLRRDEELFGAIAVKAGERRNIAT